MTTSDPKLLSVCRICHGGCAAELTVSQGRLTRVRPAPGFPFNHGRMCVKGLNTVEIMYHPDRLQTPLKRDGSRGSGRWKTISWDQCLDEIAEKLDRYRQETGPESVALGQGTGRHHYFHVIRFANTFGTPNWYEPGLANCFIPRISVSNLTYGGLPVADYYGDKPPRTIFFWGHNPLVSGPDGELGFSVEHALARGAQGVAIDPRRTETAKKCSLWLPIRPGTDAALALAMAQVIIHEDLYDRDFVALHTVGFNRLKEHVKNLTPQWAAEITGLAAEDITRAARIYALERPSVIDWGVAIEQNPNCLQAVRAVAVLRGLTGDLDVPGGELLGTNVVRAYPVLKDKLPSGMLKKRIGADEFKLLGGFRAFMPSAHIPGLYRAMDSGDPYRIRALLIFGHNPLLTVANPGRTLKALKKLDLLVVSDHFLTPTAAWADYVLPAAFWPEINQIIEMPFVAGEAVFAQTRAVEVGQCRQNEEILIDLARRLNLPDSEETLEDILDYRLQPLGLTFKELCGQFMAYPPHQYRKFEAKGFRTPSRKVELYSKSLEKLGYSPLPEYKDPPESPRSRPDLAAEYPYILTTGGRRAEFFHSEHRQVESLRRRRPDPLAEIHPDTAARRNVADGDWIKVASPRGEILMRARVTEDIRPDVVQVDHGWWFPEKGPPDYGVFESNANVLTSDAPPYDPAFGTYQLRGLLCRFEKTDPRPDDQATPEGDPSGSPKE